MSDSKWMRTLNMSFGDLQKTVIMGSLIFPLKINPFPLDTFLFLCVLFSLQFYCNIMRMFWPLYGWMFIGLPKYSLCQYQIKIILVFQISWERDIVCEAEMTKGCVDWVFRSFSLPTGDLEEWVWGHCQVIDSPVLLWQRASLSESTCDRGHLDHLERLSGLWRVEMHFIL